MENKIELNENLEFVAPVNNINVLLIAPHGVQGDDDNTGTLTRLMAKKLGCAAIINEYYSRPKEIEGSNKKEAVNEKDKIVNLNSVKEIKKAGLKVSFLDFIQQTKDSIRKNNKGNPCYVFLIHGIEDNKLLKASKENSQILIGIGSHKISQKSRWSANPVHTKEFIKFLKKLDPTVNSEITTHQDYAGWSSDNLTQALCEKNNILENRYTQCIQLEIKKVGFRDDDDDEILNKTSELLTQAIKQFTGKFNVPSLALEAVNKEEGANQDNVSEQVEDQQLIARAYETITNTFSFHAEQALMSVGEYIIEEFYRGDYELARKGQQGAHKKKSLNSLIEQLNETPGAPSKSWIYNAVKLVVEAYDIEINDPELFQTYGKLLLSHKILLLSVKNLKKKIELIHEIIKENYTIRQLKERIGLNSANKAIPFLQALNSPDKFVIEYDDIIETEAISQLSLPVIQKAHDKAAGKVKEFEERIASFIQKIEEQKKLITRYNHVVSSLEAAAKHKEQGDIQQV